MTHQVTELLVGVVTFFLYGMLGAVGYYLGSRAVITRWLWSRYPKALDDYMLCAACSGFAYGTVLAIIGGHAFDLPYLLFPGRDAATPLIAGLCSIWVVPVFASRHLLALETTSPAMPPDQGDRPPEAPDGQA